MRSVVPLICAGATRASQGAILDSAPPATPTPAAVRNCRRVSLLRERVPRVRSIAFLPSAPARPRRPMVYFATLVLCFATLDHGAHEHRKHTSVRRYGAAGSPSFIQQYTQFQVD